MGLKGGIGLAQVCLSHWLLNQQLPECYDQSELSSPVVAWDNMSHDGVVLEQGRHPVELRVDVGALYPRRRCAAFFCCWYLGMSTSLASPPSASRGDAQPDARVTGVRRRCRPSVAPVLGPSGSLVHQVVDVGHGVVACSIC